MGSTLGFSCGEHTYSGFSVAEAVVNNMVHPSHKITYIHQGLVVMSALGMIITLAAMNNFGTFKKWSSDGTFSYSRKYTIEAKKFNNTSRTNKIDGITYSFYGDVLDDKLKFRKYDLLTNITSGYSKDIKCIQVETSSPYGLSFESFKIDLFINYSFNKSYIDTISSRSIYDFRPSKNASFRYFGLTYYGSSYVAYAYVYKIYVYIG